MVIDAPSKAFWLMSLSDSPSVNSFRLLQPLMKPSPRRIVELGISSLVKPVHPAKASENMYFIVFGKEKLVTFVQPRKAPSSMPVTVYCLLSYVTELGITMSPLRDSDFDEFTSTELSPFNQYCTPPTQKYGAAKIGTYDVRKSSKYKHRFIVVSLSV